MYVKISQVFCGTKIKTLKDRTLTTLSCYLDMSSCLELEHLFYALAVIEKEEKIDLNLSGFAANNGRFEALSLSK